MQRYLIGLAWVVVVCLFPNCAAVEALGPRTAQTKTVCPNSMPDVEGQDKVGVSHEVFSHVVPSTTAVYPITGIRQAFKYTSALQTSSNDVDQEMTPARPASDDGGSSRSTRNDVLLADAITNDSPPAPPTASAPQRLALHDAIQLAVSNNPDLITARAAGPVSNAGRLVAATYPWNPSVQVEVSPFAEDISGTQLSTRNVVSLTQPLELAHQSRYRIRGAEAGWNQQQALIAQTELATSVATMRAYFDALYRLGLWDLAKDSATLQRKTVDAIERRFAAGLSTPTERTTVRILERQTQRAADLARVDFQAAQSSLRSVLGLSVNTELYLAPRLESYNWRAESSVASDFGIKEAGGNVAMLAVDSVAISNRPDVYAARLAASQAKANLDLARANMIPNIATGPTYERDESGTLFFGVAAQMDVPVWNTGGSLVRQRAAEYQQQLITAEQTRRRAVLQAQAAFQRYSLAYSLWRDQQSIKSATLDDIRVVVDAFEHGQASYLEVLSARDGLMQDRKSQLDLLHEISQAAADIVAALAVDPESLLKSTPGEAPEPAN